MEEPLARGQPRGLRGVALALGALLFLGTACQDHQFVPLAPVTYRRSVQAERIVSRQYKPNLMLVIDRSQSMNFPMENGQSRWAQLKDAFASYLTQHGNVARMGLVTFPVDDACGAGEVVVDLWTQSDLPDDLQGHAFDINQQLQGTVPGGVTPVGDTLRLLADYGSFDPGRDNYVLVATDGLPNCNASNPNSHDVDPVACDCNFAPGQCGGENARLGCLDRDGAIDAVRTLLSKGVKTAIVGFGADALDGLGPQVLNAIASEGGAPRSCPGGTDAECGSLNACNAATGLCDMRYYQAPTGAELVEALATIGQDLSKREACVHHLSGAPSDPSLLSVILNGEALESGPSTWTFDPAAGVVSFTGVPCQTLSNSTPDDPAQVEFYTVGTL